MGVGASNLNGVKRKRSHPDTQKVQLGMRIKSYCDPEAGVKVPYRTRLTSSHFLNCTHTSIEAEKL